MKRVVENYFKYTNASDYVKEFPNYISSQDLLTYTNKCTYGVWIFKQKIDRYDSSLTITQTDISNCVNAFRDYLYDNYECEWR